MQYSRSIPRQATSNARSSVSATGRSPSPNSSNLLSFNENEVWMAEYGTLVFSCWYLLFYLRHSVLLCCCRWSLRLLFAILLYVSTVKHFMRLLVFRFLMSILHFQPYYPVSTFKNTDNVIYMLSADGRYSFKSENTENEYDVREALSNIKK